LIRQREVGLAQHQPQHRWEKRHQHDVELQNVEIERPRFQQQPVDQCPHRMIDQPGDIEFVDQVGSGISRRHVRDGHEVDHEQDDVGGIDLPRALEDPACADDEAAFERHLGVDDRGRITGNEDEHVGGAREPVVPDRDPVHEIVGNVVQKDEPVRDAAKQVDPGIAPVCRDNSLDVHEGGFVPCVSRGVIGIGDSIGPES
jgi:hypothetical protein